MTKKTYPDRTLEKRLRERGATVVLNWEMRGPKNTAIAWLSCYTIYGPKITPRVFMVQTYHDVGWADYPSNDLMKIEDTLSFYLPKQEA